MNLNNKINKNKLKIRILNKMKKFNSITNLSLYMMFKL